MPRIASIATALPPHQITLAETLHHEARVFDRSMRGIDRLLNVVARSGIETRHVVSPVDKLVETRSLAESSRAYREHALRLALEAIPPALERARISPQQVDHLITVSCTGVMIPSLDAELMNELTFRSDCRRTPITELGCAAGAVGLSRAYEHVRAYPGSTVLLVSVEIPSLTLQTRDQSMANVVASALFADGAAAAVITGRPSDGPTIIATRSELFPSTQRIMGFDLRDGGFHIVLDRDLVPLLDREATGLVQRLLEPHGLTPRDLRFFALHPGGRRLLEVLEERLGIDHHQTFASWSVLRECGNMSSATVLFVLERLARERPPSPGELGLLAAFGPGFSAETLLLRWN